MARRMFSSAIVGSDPFLEMPPSTQTLYFHLGMAADDEGFAYPKRVIRSVGAAEDDLKILLAKKFVLAFESGIVVIKHWNVNNTIRYDRRLKTTHYEEKALLRLDESGVYSLIDNQDAAYRLRKEVSNKVIKKGNKNKNSFKKLSDYKPSTLT